MKLYQIERRKYRRQGLGILLAVFIGLQVLIAGVQLFQKSGLSVSDSVRVLRVFDGLAVFSVILLPIFLASLVSISVQLENRHQMWKVLQATGVSFPAIFCRKIIYVFGRYLLAQLVTWGIVLGMVCLSGLGQALDWGRLTWYGGSFLVVSLAIVELHFYLSLRVANQLISLALALLGSLVSVILVFLPFPLMWAIPYAWYGYLMSLLPEKMGDSFTFQIREVNWLALGLGLFLAIFLHLINQDQKARN